MAKPESTDPSGQKSSNPLHPWISARAIGREPGASGAADDARPAPAADRTSGAARWLSGALALVAALAAAITFFADGVLHGTAVMNGSARGTALVVLVLAVPILALSMLAAGRGSVRARVAWLGAVGYLLYNSVLFLFATPFNSLFLLYVAMFGLSAWSAIVLLRQTGRPSVAEWFDRRLPARAIAAYAWVIAVLNGLAWLVQVVPALFSSESPAFLVGTGLTTSPVYVQDLSFWVPLMVVAAFWLWRRETWGLLIVGALLTMFVIESVGIAVDQAMGHAADPTSPAASAAIVPFFVALAVVGLVPLFFYYRNLDRRAGA